MKFKNVNAIFKIFTVSLCCIYSGIIFAKGQNKTDMVALKYDLIHETCDKGNCKSSIVSSGEIKLELDKETETYFWKYQPVEISLDEVDATLRFKVALSIEKNKTERSIEIAVVEKGKSDKSQISWGEVLVKSKNWPTEQEITIKGNSYQLNGKTITPSASVRPLKK